MFNMLEAMKQLNEFNQKFNLLMQSINLIQIMIKQIHASNATPEQLEQIASLDKKLNEVKNDYA